MDAYIYDALRTVRGKGNKKGALFTITPRYGLGADVGEADSNFNLMFTYER